MGDVEIAVKGGNPRNQPVEWGRLVKEQEELKERLAKKWQEEEIRPVVVQGKVESDLLKKLLRGANG
jgi:hypothetical protein